MDDFPIETHPFAPVLPPRARVMMMGTFPPAAAKRCMAFHYPNFQNDMWRIYGLVFFNDAGYFQVAGEKRFDAGKIRDFLMAHNIALCPTVRRAVRERGNASDKFLRIVEPVDLGAVLAQLPDCRWLFTTGGKACSNPRRPCHRSIRPWLLITTAAICSSAACPPARVLIR